METKQYIVLRKDARTINGEPVSAQKLAVMASHASMAFLSRMVQANEKNGRVSFDLDSEVKEWLDNSFTKVLLRAKNLNEMNKIVSKAKENGFVENKDFFCIRDLCKTELIPDDGEKTCFTAIGFRPMEAGKLDNVVKRLQLYR